MKQKHCLLFACLLVWGTAVSAHGETTEAAAAYPRFSGIYPHLAALSDSYTESGIATVVPWADRLWYVSYVAHKSGARVGLYEISPDLKIRRRPESIVGTHAGRMIHRESNQLIIGPYVIDGQGGVRVLQHLAHNERVTAIARHLSDPARKVYVQAMEGKYYEVDVHSLQTRLLGDARQELGIRGRAHFKGAYTAGGRYVVANNSYDASDARRGSGDGRLAAFDGKSWTIVHNTAFCDVTTAAGVEAVGDDPGPLYSIGWDKRSVLLAVLADGCWTTYRLPKGSPAYDHAWCTEWPRIREAQRSTSEPGQLLLDMHGLFYKFPPQFGPGDTGGLEPWAYHLRMTPDFGHWQGRLVMAGDQNSSMGHRNRTGGQPQSNLLFTSLAEVKQWGKPAGWGGPWLEDEVNAGAASEPFLIRGFTRRCLHVVQQAQIGRTKSSGSTASTRFTLEIDQRGTGKWTRYKTLEVSPGGYAWHAFADDLPGCWARITPDRDTIASAQFTFGPHETRENNGPHASLFRSLSRSEGKKPQIRGGLLPFADRLWFTAYPADADGRAKHGGGLYEIDRDMKLVRRKESIPGVFANRKTVGGMLSIGPHLVSDDGRLRTIRALQGEHVAASIRHTTDGGKMFFLTADGRLLQADLQTLEVELAADIAEELELKDAGLQFKAGHRAGRRIFVTAVAGDGRSGCLAEFDGKHWRLLDRRPFIEVTDWASMSQAVVATGWDRASAILKIRQSDGDWVTYRLPKAGNYDDTVRTDRHPRIREVETERLLMDLGGIFYETTGLGHVWFVRPIATHGRVVSDFCSWRGLLVLAGNHADAKPDANYVRGDDGVGLWFGKTDDLWRFGKATGRGGPWRLAAVKAGEPSEPYLMTNFQDKRVELSHDADRPVKITILVDVLGTRKSWKTYRTLTVGAGETAVHHFPHGYSAHWVRVKADRDCRATAWFIYD